MKKYESFPVLECFLQYYSLKRQEEEIEIQIVK